MIDVYDATINDLDRLILLNKQVHEIHSKKYPEIFKVEVDALELKAFFGGLLDDVNHYVLLAKNENNTVGYIWGELIQRSESLFTHKISKAWVHHIAVEKEFRGRNIGKMLLSSFESRLKEQGINHIAVDSWSFNDTAVSFFKANNYTTYNEVMWKLS